MTEVAIKGIENVTSEGVTLALTKPARLKSGNVRGDKVRVSWDKIGKALIEGYTDADTVAEMRQIRGEQTLAGAHMKGVEGE